MFMFVTFALDERGCNKHKPYERIRKRKNTKKNTK